MQTTGRLDDRVARPQMPAPDCSASPPRTGCSAGCRRACRRARRAGRTAARAPATWATVTPPSRAGRERDPCRQGMALGRHERERLVVGVDDHDAGREPDRRPGDGRDLQQRDLARGDPGQRRVEPRPSGQNVGKCSFQIAMTASRLMSAPSSRTERLLPHLAEALERAGDALPGDGIVGGSDRRRREPCHRVSPGAAVLRFHRWILLSCPAGRDGRVGVVVDPDRLVEAGQREDLAVVVAQAGRDEPRHLRCARTSSVTSNPMPPLFMYSSRRSRERSSAPRDRRP